MRAQLFAIVALLVGVARPFAAEVDDSKTPIEALISDITLVDAEGPGFQSTAFWTGFIGDESRQEFSSGVLGSPAPVVAPQLGGEVGQERRQSDQRDHGMQVLTVHRCPAAGTPRPAAGLAQGSWQCR